LRRGWVAVDNWPKIPPPGKLPTIIATSSVAITALRAIRLLRNCSKRFKMIAPLSYSSPAPLDVPDAPLEVRPDEPDDYPAPDAPLEVWPDVPDDWPDVPDAPLEVWPDVPDAPLEVWPDVPDAPLDV